MNPTVAFIAKSVIAGLALAFVAVVLRPSLLTGGRGAEPPGSYADAVSRSSVAVVNVYSAKTVEESALSPLFGRRLPPAAWRPRTATSLGSGVIMSGDGYIVTNDHVIADADDIYVAFADEQVARATVMGTDPDTDIALLHVDAGNLPTMPLGRSDTLRVGDIVLAIGNPFGIGKTVTQGIVSATGRDQLGLNRFEDFVQTDASINPGNSGGALVNTAGELVGINTAIVGGVGSEGIGFAIPVNLVRGVVNELIEHGRVIRGSLGVSAEEIPPELARQLGLDQNGAIVLTRVRPDTPAAAAGLRRGDIITGVNDQPIIKLQDALNAVARLEPGTTVSLTGLHANGAPFQIETRVIERIVNGGRGG